MRRNWAASQLRLSMWWAAVRPVWWLDLCDPVVREWQRAIEDPDAQSTSITLSRTKRYQLTWDRDELEETVETWTLLGMWWQARRHLDKERVG